jgi:hypothetical protein
MTVRNNQDTIVRILGRRPTSLPQPHPSPIPPDATIYNGPALLLGSQQDGMGLAWLGWPIAGSGAHYAAVLADDPHAEDLRAHNRAVGGIVVEYVSLFEVRQVLSIYYRDELNMPQPAVRMRLADMDDQSLWREYVARGLNIDRAGEASLTGRA